MSKKVFMRIVVVMALAMSFLLCSNGISAYADTDSTGKWEYDVFTDSAYITGYYGEETEITIPSEVDGYVVEGIDCFAFEDYSHFKSVTFPETLRSIEAGAFYNCSGLESMYIPKSVIWVAWDSFAGCSSLTSIVVDKDNKKYDSRNNCNAIIEKKSSMLVSGCKNTVIPKNVKKIGDSAFYGCTGLNGIKIPGGVKSIGEYTFAECTGLKSIVIPDSVTSIDSYAFDDIGKHFIVYSSADSCARTYAKERKIKWRDKNSTSLDAFIVSLNKKVYSYDGKEKKPAVTVQMGTEKLVKGKDYRIVYADNVKVGTATVSIMGIGKYSGTVTKTFAIRPSQVKGLKKKVSYETNEITLTWKKMPGVDGYEVYMQTGENGKYKKVKTVKATVTKYTKSKLVKGKKYSFKVRAYKVMGGKKVYSDWSSVKSVKMK